MLKLFLVFVALILVGSVLLTLGIRSTEYELDVLEVNRIIMTIGNQWPMAQSGRLPESLVNYVFVPDGQPVSAHIANRDTLIEVYADGQLVGRIAVVNEGLAAIQSRYLTVFYIMAALFAVICVLLALHLYTTILRPFKKLEAFATRVAQGDLEFQLEMDKKNRFGAFSESFDLMRVELAAARESERLANIRKKELVASLSHDVKTPVTSIKVVAELYQAKHGQSAEMDSILKKADQIDLLISNMFTATLEELRQLKVSPEEVTTSQLAECIRASDYLGKVLPFTLPECVVTADSLRFRQIIDNIIDNSYKYAGTDIEVTGGIDGEFFTLTVRDFGTGVSSEEITLLCEKYFRAGNAGGKSGSGLGLYLTQYFLSEMGGSLSLQNNNGLWVTMKLKI